MTHALPYWRLSGFYFCYFSLLGATAPFLALYFDHLGFSAARIGELVAIHPARHHDVEDARS